jgi:hypothetical protein
VQLSYTTIMDVALSSSLLDDLGRVRRVQARPVDAGRFARAWTRRPAAKGGQLRGGRGRGGARSQLVTPGFAAGPRMIAGPLAGH